MLRWISLSVAWLATVVTGLTPLACVTTAMVFGSNLILPPNWWCRSFVFGAPVDSEINTRKEIKTKEISWSNFLREKRTSICLLFRIELSICNRSLNIPRSRSWLVNSNMIKRWRWLFWSNFLREKRTSICLLFRIKIAIFNRSLNSSHVPDLDWYTCKQQHDQQL